MGWFWIFLIGFVSGGVGTVAGVVGFVSFTDAYKVDTTKEFFHALWKVVLEGTRLLAWALCFKQQFERRFEPPGTQPQEGDVICNRGLKLVVHKVTAEGVAVTVPGGHPRHPRSEFRISGYDFMLTERWSGGWRIKKRPPVPGEDEWWHEPRVKEMMISDLRPPKKSTPMGIFHGNNFFGVDRMYNNVYEDEKESGYLAP